MLTIKKAQITLNLRATSHEDPYSRAAQDAMSFYADAIKPHDPKLTSKLRGWIRKEAILQDRRKAKGL